MNPKPSVDDLQDNIRRGQHWIKQRGGGAIRSLVEKSGVKTWGTLSNSENL